MLEGLGFLFGELTRFDELVHQGLVARELHELTLPQQVPARVADLREEEMAVDQRGRRHRRAHAAARPVDLRLLEDAETGRLDRPDQAPREVVAREGR